MSRRCSRLGFGVAFVSLLRLYLLKGFPPSCRGPLSIDLATGGYTFGSSRNLGEGLGFRIWGF